MRLIGGPFCRIPKLYAFEPSIHIAPSLERLESYLQDLFYANTLNVSQQTALFKHVSMTNQVPKPASIINESTDNTATTTTTTTNDDDNNNNNNSSNDIIDKYNKKIQEKVMMIYTLLQYGCDGTIPSYDNATPLYQCNNTSILLLLLDNGIDINAITTKHHVTALSSTLTYNNPDITSLLLKYNADYTICDTEGNTPLHTSRDAQCTKLLLDAKSDPNQQTYIGQTALHKAINKDIIQYLLDYNANPYIYDHHGDTVLHTTIQNYDNIYILLYNKCNPNIPNYNTYQTPLYNIKTLNILQLFMQYSGDINVIDKSYNTLLHTYTSDDMIQCILDNQFKISAGHNMAMYIPTVQPEPEHQHQDTTDSPDNPHNRNSDIKQDQQQSDNSTNTTISTITNSTMVATTTGITTTKRLRLTPTVVPRTRPPPLICTSSSHFLDSPLLPLSSLSSSQQYISQLTLPYTISMISSTLPSIRSLYDIYTRDIHIKLLLKYNIQQTYQIYSLLYHRSDVELLTMLLNEILRKQQQQQQNGINYIDPYMLITLYNEQGQTPLHTSRSIEMTQSIIYSTLHCGIHTLNKPTCSKPIDISYYDDDNIMYVYLQNGDIPSTLPKETPQSPSPQATSTPPPPSATTATQQQQEQQQPQATLPLINTTQPIRQGYRFGCLGYDPLAAVRRIDALQRDHTGIL